MHSLRVLKVMNLLPYFYLSENSNLSCLVLNWFYNGHSEAGTVLVATLTILKFSESSQLIAMAFKLAWMLLFCSYLFNDMRRNIVPWLVHIKLEIIFDFFMKFISGRRILPNRSRTQNQMRKSNLFLKSESNMLLKMHKSFDY